MSKYREAQALELHDAHTYLRVQHHDAWSSWRKFEDELGINVTLDLEPLARLLSDLQLHDSPIEINDYMVARLTRKQSQLHENIKRLEVRVQGPRLIDISAVCEDEAGEEYTVETTYSGSYSIFW